MIEKLKQKKAKKNKRLFLLLIFISLKIRLTGRLCLPQRKEKQLNIFILKGNFRILTSSL